MRRSQDPNLEEEDVEDEFRLPAAGPAEEQRQPSLPELAHIGGVAMAQMSRAFVEAMKASTAMTSAFRKTVEQTAAMDTPGSQHVLFFPEGGAWVVHHPLACRQPNWWSLASCPMPEAVRTAESLPYGWHLFTADEDGKLVFAALADEAVPS
jgi:hypothetical protein